MVDLRSGETAASDEERAHPTEELVSLTDGSPLASGARLAP
jgi:hypothetical protein